MILDEVMCGMGRTGTLFACEMEYVAPDMICLAKGLGAAVMPIGATLCTGEIYQTIAGGSGAFRHGHTYCAHPTSCAAGLAALGEIIKLLPQVRDNNLLLQLRAAFGKHRHIGDIRGARLFIGMDSPAPKRLLRAMQRRDRAKVQRFNRRTLVNALGGCADGMAISY